VSLRLPALAAALAGACRTPDAPPTAPGPDLAWSQLVGDDLEVFARRDGVTQRLTTREGADFAGPVAPDGASLVVIHSAQDGDVLRQQLWLHPLDGGAPVALSEVAPLVRSPRWAPSGDAVVYESSRDSFRDLYRATRDGGVTRISRSPHGCFEPAPLGDGATVIAPCSGQDVDLYRLSGGATPVGPLLTRAGEDGAPALSPDGATVAFLAAEGPRVALHRLRLADLQHRRVWAPADTRRLVPDQGLVWSADGSRIAAVTRGEDGDAAVVVVEADTGAVVAQTAGDLPAFTADGALLVTHEDDDGQGIFRVDPSTGSRARVAPPGAWLGRPLSTRPRQGRRGEGEGAPHHGQP
jgi:Tol biopolymer transport system component